MHSNNEQTKLDHEFHVLQLHNYEATEDPERQLEWKKLQMQEKQMQLQEKESERRESDL